MNSVVSIIIPIYNTEAYLSDVIESVMRQSYTQLEIILVDDGSTDDSFGICKEYLKKDSRIVVLTQKNSGASIARNTGLDHATGEYVMFVDSDDWIDPQMVEMLVKEMEESCTDLVISQIPGDRRLYDTKKLLGSDEALKNLLFHRIWWSPCGKLFRSSHLKSLRFPKSTIAEDYWMMAHLLLKTNNIVYLPQNCYHRTTRNNSLSHLSLCQLKFDEINNVMDVCNTIRQKKPQYFKYAERNLAETLLKLVILVASSSEAFGYKKQLSMMTKTIRRFFWSMYTNSVIPIKQKILLIPCTTPSIATIFFKHVSFI